MNRVETVRKGLSLTQSEFASILQVHRTTVSTVESGIVELPVKAQPWFERLASAGKKLSKKAKGELKIAAQSVDAGSLPITDFWALITQELA